MKKNIALLLLIVVANVFAQKVELKTLKKVFKSGDYSAAKSSIEKYENVFSSASEKEKQKFVQIKIKTYYNLAKENPENLEWYGKFSETYKQLEDPGSDIDQMKSTLLIDLRKIAVESYSNKDYSNAIKRFESLYKLNPKDTLSLYSAASIAVSDSNHYDTALKYYKELLDINYDGSRVNYMAVNKSTKKEEVFPSRIERDLRIKMNTHDNPKEEKILSKKPEIVKNIAIILIQQGKQKEALEAINKAIENNPDDQILILSKADIYYKMKKYDAYEKTIQIAISKDPNNPDLYYNIGVAKSNNKNYKEAVEYYQKALTIKSDYLNAVLNLSSAYLELGNGIVNEMNKVSDSKINKNIDWDKYDKLKKQREDYYKDGAKVLEEFLKDRSGEKSVLEQLKNIYGALGDEENFARVKKILE